MAGVKTLGTDAELRAALLDADEPYLTGENAQNVHMRSSRLNDGSGCCFSPPMDRELCADARRGWPVPVRWRSFDLLG